MYLSTIIHCNDLKWAYGLNKEIRSFVRFTKVNIRKPDLIFKCRSYGQVWGQFESKLAEITESEENCLFVPHSVHVRQPISDGFLDYESRRTLFVATFRCFFG